MSDKEDEEQPPEKPFYVDRAKTGRATCKKCKQKICQGELRFAKLGYNPFGTGTMKLWHHIPCIFEVFKKQRPTTRKIESPDDIGGWEELSKEDKDEIMSYFSPELKKVFEAASNKSSSDRKSKNEKKNDQKNKDHKDNSFHSFRKLCVRLSSDSSYLIKTKMVADLFEKGSDGDGFKGDVELWCKLLLPAAVVRVYNLQNKQLVKLFSRILGTNHEEMLEDLEKGDVAETIAEFFKKSDRITPSSKSTLTLQDVDDFLEKLSKMTKEDEQSHHFKSITKKCTTNDLRTILRLIKHDLRINAGPKHILEALHKDAYKAFQACKDLKAVVKNALKAREKDKAKDKQVKDAKGMAIGISMMTPVLPMLAQPCKSVQMAFEKCPNGMFSEIKYDGERLQLHKQGDTFKYFSRSLKPVMPHKVAHFKDYIPQAFPHGKDLILDAEILMVDNKTGKPLPFGTLGIHKKSEFKDANVCLFVFDCMHYNGESLLGTAIRERKEILRRNMVEIKNHIVLTEMEEIHKAEQLEKMMTKVFKLGLEGLVLKDLNSTYEPGKRHWLKVKKDYLFDGAIADTADLVVLGAWFGTGSKGGIMSSFLMGCHDPKTKKWVTVTKVSGGHDDKTLEKIQKELKVVKISKDPSKVPKWLNCTKTMIPDFVAADPEKMPVWEITGAEFTCNQVHTANGISLRFPRITKIRKDKDWMSATNLEELKELYKKSKETSDFNLNKLKSAASAESVDDDEGPTKAKRRKRGPDEGESSKSAETGDEDRTHQEDTDVDTDVDTETEPEGVQDREDRMHQEGTDVDTDVDTETEPESVQNREESTPMDIANPLHDIFTGCVIQFPKDHRHYNFLRRYIIAYDGALHDEEKNGSLENSNRKVTHVVHLRKMTEIRKEKFWAKDVRHVHVNWIWDSIKLLEKQPESRYTVTAKDSK